MSRVFPTQALWAVLGWVLVTPPVWAQEPEPAGVSGDPVEESRAQKSPSQGGAPEAAPEVAPQEQQVPWLEALAARSQGRLVLTPMGDAGVLTLGTLLPLADSDGTVAPEPEDLPAVLLCGDSEPHRNLLESLVDRGEDTSRRLARELVVYFLPSFGEGFEDPSGVALRADFPINWTPHALNPEAGQAPFRRADSALIRELLVGHPNLLLLLEGPRSNPSAWAAFESDRAAAVASRKVRGAHVSSEGGLGPYCWDVFGVPIKGLPEDPLSQDSSSLGESGARYLWESIPRIEVVVLETETLADGQRRVDLRITNRGTWPTFSETAQVRRGGLGLRLEVMGVDVVAVAMAEADQPYGLRRGRSLEDRWRLPLDPLQGHSERRVRLIVSAGPQTAFTVAVDSAWTRRLDLLVPLE